MEDTSKLDEFIGIRSLLRVTELHEKLTKPIFLLKDVGVQYRTVLHWDQQGLLEHSREESEWRRYDYIQYVWIKIINDLRTFGVPIPIIEKAKTEILTRINLKWLFELFSLNKEYLDKLTNDEAKSELLSFLESKSYESIDDNLSVSFLELMIVETLTTKVPVSLNIFSDGFILPLFESKLDVFESGDVRKLTYETHVKISISNILNNFLSDTKDSFLIPQLQILADNERRLLEIIHSGEYETVTINFKNKKMKTVELIKEQNVKRKIVDILQDSNYQDIVIKSHKGVVTRIQNTVKLVL
ncbi:MAG: MerR family transcriptional regulator [Cytophagales bacterium]